MEVVPVVNVGPKCPFKFMYRCIENPLAHRNKERPRQMGALKMQLNSTCGMTQDFGWENILAEYGVIGTGERRCL